MAGVLNIPQHAHAPVFVPVLRPLRTPNSSTSLSVRASSSADSPDASSIAAKERSVATFAPPPGFKPPEPKRFTVRPDKLFDILGASLSLVFRLGTGVFVSGYSASLASGNEIPPGQYALDLAGIKVKETSKIGPRPEKPIEIYEFESCPFCRKVREIVSILDLDVVFYPCPRNGPIFRPKVAEMGGKKQFPYMIDPNTGVAMYESDDIIKYLVTKYGDGQVPFLLSLGLFTTLTEGFAMIGRIGKGTSYVPAKSPPKMLELWAYEFLRMEESVDDAVKQLKKTNYGEYWPGSYFDLSRGSPFCKLVREALVELELPHLVQSCARGSPKRNILYQKAGRFQVPYLEDPNTGVQMFESAEIVEYLKATYAL